MTGSHVQAQSTDPRYFPETGHFVGGEFLKFYLKIKDAQILFGYPITEQIISKDGLTVQYFQRARFEWHPELADGQRVQLTLIGKATYSPGSGQLPIFNPFACRYFAKTGYSVCYAFLDFFNQHGGVEQFGNPISPFEYHNDLIVQYFEKARFEWKPAMPEGQRVVITDLGRIYFEQVTREDPNLLKALPPPNNNIGQIISIQARAFVWKAVTLASDQQLIYIIAQDQTLQPVPGAQGTATIHWPSGNNEIKQFLTNSSGVGIVSLSFTNQPYGTLVNIDISVSIGGLTGTTTTSFRIWY
jgi:hypothetical protein